MLILDKPQWRQLYIYAWGGYNILKAQFGDEMNDRNFEELLEMIKKDNGIETLELNQFLNGSELGKEVS